MQNWALADIFSLLNIPAEAEKQKDTAERLADHMSEYETTRFGEVLGVSIFPSSIITC